MYGDSIPPLPNYGLLLIMNYRCWTAHLSERDRLGTADASIADQFEFLLWWDTSPDFDIININVARAATHIFIPVTPLPLHMKRLSHSFKALEKVVVEFCGKGGWLYYSDISGERTRQQRAYLEIFLAGRIWFLVISCFGTKDTFIPKSE